MACWCATARSASRSRSARSRFRRASKAFWPRASIVYRRRTRTCCRRFRSSARNFRSAWCERSLDKGEDELAPMMSELQLGEFIYEQPAFPDVEYVFKHALTQEVAYDSVLIERRKLIHEKTANALETMYAQQTRGARARTRVSLQPQRQPRKGDHLSGPGGRAGARSERLRGDDRSPDQGPRIA